MSSASFRSFKFFDSFERCCSYYTKNNFPHNQTVIVISSFMEEQAVRVLLYTVYIFVKRSADHVYIDKIVAERH